MEKCKICSENNYYKINFNNLYLRTDSYNKDLHIFESRVCANCGVVYQFPQITPEKIAEYYKKSMRKTKFPIYFDKDNFIDFPLHFEQTGISFQRFYLFYKIIEDQKNNYKDLKKANEENYKLKTGDLGFFDKDGFFYITSRISKIAKIVGYRVDIGALENLMSQKGYKVACLSDNKKIFIFIEKKYNKTNLINTISKITNLNINSLELIKLKYLPRTANNKISYHELKKIDARL